MMYASLIPLEDIQPLYRTDAEKQALSMRRAIESQTIGAPLLSAPPASEAKPAKRAFIKRP